MAQHTKTVGWVPEDEEVTTKREVGDEVGGHWPEGPRVVTKVTRPYMDRDGPAVTPAVTGAKEHLPGGAESVTDAPPLHPRNPKLGEGPRSPDEP